MGYKILLDMDGVIADFVSGYCAYWNVTNPYLYKESLGKYALLPYRDLGKDCEEFWKNINPTLDGFSIVNVVRLFDPNFVICSTPYTAGKKNCRIRKDCISGKKAWLSKHFSLEDWSGRLDFRRDKSVLATPEHILIDDCESNVDKFKIRGGKSILVPRPWNRLGYAHTAKKIRLELLEICKK